jgi:hypothetical protein
MFIGNSSQRQLVTLKDGGDYITELPNAEHSALAGRDGMLDPGD